MKTSVENIDPVTVKLTVEVEPKRVKQAFDRAAKELAKQVSLPGFRPGKAPRRLLEQRLGTGAVAQTAMENSLSDFYVEALQAEDLDPVAQPEVDVESFDEHEGATFTAEVQIRPTFEVPDHAGISVTFPEWDVDEDEVTEQLGSMRERFAEVDEVERAAKKGDLVTIDLKVEVDGEELEGASVEDALYEIGSAGVTPKLDEEAVGKEAGDTFSYEDALPEDYPEHGGKDAVFHVTVKDVREKTLPDLDDDFATTASGFDTIDELRGDVRNSIQRRKVEQAQHQLRARVLEAYLARVDVELPPAMLESEQEQRLHEVEHQAERFGLEVDQVFEAQGTTREEFEEQSAAQARESVKAQLVLDALGKKLQPNLDPSDIDQEIVRHAQANNMDPNQVAQIIQQQGSLPALIGDILRRKTIDAIIDAADIDGGPSDEQLIELGLKQDPDAPAAVSEQIMQGATVVEAPDEDLDADEDADADDAAEVEAADDADAAPDTVDDAEAADDDADDAKA
ncbi:MAG: trigger factor [Nitriliruptoraceae bacterium]|nr:trigger factor [Nitriliruptoraceae bacterium]